MLTLAVIYQLLVTSPAEAEALRKTAPSLLTRETSFQNLVAASAVGMVHHVDADLMLYIARHESNYSSTEVTKEEGGKVSCGVMTPEPTRDLDSCQEATRSLVAGYLAGAAHLVKWRRTCAISRTPVVMQTVAELGVERCALMGYAGGPRLMRRCIEDPTLSACGTPALYLRGGAWIRGARHKARKAVS